MVVIDLDGPRRRTRTPRRRGAWTLAALVAVSAALLTGEPVGSKPLDPARLLCAALPPAGDAPPAPKRVMIINADTGEVTAVATC